MKRLLAFLLAIMMLFGLSACTQGEIEFTVDLISGVLAESDDSGSQTTAASTTVYQLATEQRLATTVCYMHMSRYTTIAALEMTVSCTADV
jgi:hypothetical protein